MGNTWSGYRWVVLAVGTLAQAATSAYFQGLAGIGPALRTADGLGLGGLGLLLACPTLGILLTMLAWGPLVDRYGERPAMTVGLLGAAVFLAGASRAHGVVGQGVLLVLAGVAGASVTTASGRAVMTWFPGHRRGAAMGVRQCAVPAGSGLAAAVLPAVTGAHGIGGAFLVLAAACAFAALAVLAFVREPPAAAAATPARAARPASPPSSGGTTRDVLSDRRLWRLSGAAGLLVVPQFTMVAFLVEVLHDGRGMPAHRAAVVLTVAQAAGAAARILVGVWSDRARARLRPLRALAVGCVVGMAVAAGATAMAPVVALAAVLVVVTAVTVCWNGLAFTAAGELAPPGRAATGMALENSVNFAVAAATPPLVGVLVTATAWEWAFLLVALAPLVSAGLLRPLLERRLPPGGALSEATPTRSIDPGATIGGAR
jgi:sugar phosphate permease